MKKITLFLMAALMLLLTQCTKNDDPVTEDNSIRMTLVADNGAKTAFDGSGAISWGKNEKVYVVVDGYCRGHLTNGESGGNTFTGTISGVSAGNYTFHYYYVGTEKEIANNATSFEMDFVDQDGTLANLGKFHVGYGSQELYYDGSSSISGIALMKSLVSIGYFDIAGMAAVGENVYMYGTNINNKISIDFSTNAVTNGKIDAGTYNFICLGAVSEGATCGKYVMLVPNHTDGTESLSTDITFVSKRTTGTCNSTFPYGIIANRFYCKGGNTSTPIDVAETSYYPGTLRGVFTVASGTTVHFSQGNLQWIGSAATPHWRFATNQYDHFGNNGQISDATNVDRDLFGWGTGDAPNKVTEDNTQYSTYHEWGDNVIVNGGNETNQWRTLTGYDGEWYYLSHTRSASTVNGTANARYAKAKISGNTGELLFPDTYVHPSGVTAPIKINNGSANYTDNIYDETQWNKMEAAGAVFIPGAGRRKGSTVYEYPNSSLYWSSTPAGPLDDNEAYAIDLYENTVDWIFTIDRNRGYSVRLVRVRE